MIAVKLVITSKNLVKLFSDTLFVFLWRINFRGDLVAFTSLQNYKIKLVPTCFFLFKVLKME